MPKPEEYISRIPASVPPNRVLVHNHVQPTRHLNARGFRAWITSPDPMPRLFTTVKPWRAKDRHTGIGKHCRSAK